MRLALPPLTPMVRRLLKLNVGVFAGYFLLWLASPPAANECVRWFGLDPLLWRQGFPFVPLWQLGSYAFLHSALDPMHLLFNMLLLYFFGTMLESTLGSGRFLAVYGGAGIFGACLHLVAELAMGHAHPVIGASGAVLGVLVATAVLRPDTMVLFLIFPIRLRWLAAGIVGLDAMQLLITMRAGGADMVAHFVHLGGALYGFVAARRGWIRWDPLGAWQAKRAVAQVERHQQDQARLDSLLKKIHGQGLGSLTQAEKDFLKRTSRRD